MASAIIFTLSRAGVCADFARSPSLFLTGHNLEKHMVNFNGYSPERSHCGVVATRGGLKRRERMRIGSQASKRPGVKCGKCE
jgi:hypothetical protein